MASLSFIPLSVFNDDVSSIRRTGSLNPPIIFGKEAVFVDADVQDLTSLRGTSPVQGEIVTRQTGAGKVLAAVVQKGRLFQRTYPDATVLRDRGRFLLVELSPDHPILLEKPAEPCFAAYRLEPGVEVFRDLDPVKLRARRDPAVDAVLECLSIETFRGTLKDLTSLHTRLSTSDLYGEAARMCRERLEALGYAATIQEFAMSGGSSSNVVAVPPGAGPISALVTGHLDSVNHVDGPNARAQGADDNGSGSAGVIAMAEALTAVRASAPAEFTVGFILFGGEEQGLLGSKHYLSLLSDEKRQALRAIINMDMIANLNPPPDGGPVVPGVTIEGGEVSRGLIENLSTQAATYTNLAVQASFNPFASDHVPFIEAGLPAVLTIEGADQANDRIHGPNDTLEHVDDGLAHQILRMNSALMASLVSSD